MRQVLDVFVRMFLNVRVEGLQNFTDQGTYLLYNAARLLDFIHLRIKQTAANKLVPRSSKEWNERCEHIAS